MSFLKNALTSIVSVAGFAALPAPSDASTSALYLVSGVGHGGFSYWKTDGSVWFPINGEVKLYEFNGDTSAPVATVSGSYASGVIQPFTTPEQLIIPAGMLNANSNIRIEAFIGSQTASLASVLLQFGNSIDGFANVGIINPANGLLATINFNFGMIDSSTVGIGGFQDINEGSVIIAPSVWSFNANCATRDCEILVGGVGAGADRTFALYGLSVWVIQ